MPGRGRARRSSPRSRSPPRPGRRAVLDAFSRRFDPRALAVSSAANERRLGSRATRTAVSPGTRRPPPRARARSIPQVLYVVSHSRPSAAMSERSPTIMSAPRAASRRRVDDLGALCLLRSFARREHLNVRGGSTERRAHSCEGVGDRAVAAPRANCSSPESSCLNAVVPRSKRTRRPAQPRASAREIPGSARRTSGLAVQVARIGVDRAAATSNPSPPPARPDSIRGAHEQPDDVSAR